MLARMRPVVGNESSLVIVEEAEDLVEVKAEVGRWAQYLTDLKDEVQALGRSSARAAVLQCVETLGKGIPPLLEALSALEKRMDQEEASGVLVIDTMPAPLQEKVYLSQGKGDRR